jgi:hypothetical protein
MTNILLPIYIKQLNPPVNIHGLLLHPQIVDDSIKWSLKNPNDLPYNIGVINGYLEELLYNFMRRTATKDSPMWDNCYEKYCRLDGNPNQKYVNKELRTKLNNAWNKFTSITLEDEDELKSDCFVKDWDFGYERNEILNIYVSLELTNPKINNIDVDDDTLEEFIKGFIYNDTAGEQELDSIWDITKIILDYPTMFDNEYMFTQAVIGYFDSFGNGLT